jgi:hypothetical protein
MNPRPSIQAFRAIRCAPNGAIASWVQVPPGQWPVGPVAIRRPGWATVPVEAPRQKLAPAKACPCESLPLRKPAPAKAGGGGRGAASGGRANRRAVTCVKPEQASKGKSWTPTRPDYGEGSTDRGSSRQTHPDRSIGVRGTAPSGQARGQAVETGDRVSGGDPWRARVAASTMRPGIGPRGSRTGSWYRRSRVTPVEGRTLTSGAFSKRMR